MININIKKRFGNTRMEFAFKAESNRVVLFGPSGAGKSVLLKMIAGFFSPEEGDILINDRVLFSRSKKTNVPTHLRNIGYLPQEYTLFPNMTVKENILYGVKVRGIPFEQKKFDYLLDRFKIRALLNNRPQDLSGGQKQRAALARILLISPDLLLLDEPFSALDTPVRESLRNLVEEIVEETKIPTLFVTHDMDEAFVFGKEAVHVQRGRTIEFGDKNRLFNRPLFIETAGLFGFSNILPIAKLKENTVEVPQGHVFSFSGPVSQNAHYFCIRPENIMFIREEKPYEKGLRRNVICGTITHIHNHGRYANVVFVSDKGMKLEINIPEHVLLRLDIHVEKDLKVSLKEESIVLCDKFEFDKQ